MEQKTNSLASGSDSKGETPRKQVKGTQTDSTLLTDALTPCLIEAVSRDNMRAAFKRVKANKGAPGVDGLTVDELAAHLKVAWPEIRQQLLEGTYVPQPVRRVTIPKPTGGVRNLGIPTVVDRLIQQALLQVLTSIFDPTFSDSSYGFRPGRSAHQALRAAKQYVAGGKTWVVDMDLEQFFDRVNHDLLMARLARKVQDKTVLKLIRAYLNAGVMAGGVKVQTETGTPQGGPLSPLLANILLDDLDRELTKRGHSFCRYADDCNIYVASQRAGERTMASVTNFVERKLKLTVNQKKSAVGRPVERKFLGLRVIGGKESYISIAPQSLERFKKKVRKLTKRNRGVSLDRVLADLNRYTTGWVHYFGIAKARSIAQRLDGWIRRRLRCYMWKQWKTWRCRVDHLLKAGLDPQLAYGIASGKHGPWKVAGTPAMTIAVSNHYFEELGYQSLYTCYMALSY
jgi:RNA-directed DNA polymerase